MQRAISIILRGNGDSCGDDDNDCGGIQNVSSGEDGDDDDEDGSGDYVGSVDAFDYSGNEDDNNNDEDNNDGGNTTIK